MQVSRFPDLTAAVSHYLAAIDEAAGRARARFVSLGDLVGAEYRRAADTAQAYADAGYADPVPAPVQAWADATGMSAQQAADDIIATRDAWIAVLDQIRAIRLSAKEQVRSASTARAAHDAAQQAIAQLDAIVP